MILETIFYCFFNLITKGMKNISNRYVIQLKKVKKNIIPLNTMKCQICSNYNYFRKVKGVYYCVFCYELNVLKKKLFVKESKAQSYDLSNVAKEKKRRY